MADVVARHWLTAQLKGLGSIGQFLLSVWQSSVRLTIAALFLRVLRAVIPVGIVLVGKLIIDQVAPLALMAASGRFTETQIPTDHLLFLIGVEFLLAISADISARLVEYVEALLSEKFSNEMSIRLLWKAGELDLQSYEDSEIQDQIDRARRQANGRSPLLGQLFSFIQNGLSLILFATGIVVYAPWLMLLILLALIPAFIGDIYFNMSAYLFAYSRTPDRRALDYIRQLGSTVENAKEVKVFGLIGFLIARFKTIASSLYVSDREIATKSTFWGAVLTTIATGAYYLAYAFIIWSTIRGRYSIGDLTFLAASFRQLRSLGDDLLTSVSQISNQAVNLDELYSFLALDSRIVSPIEPKPFPKLVAKGIQFEGVGYQYPGTNEWAVRKLTFSIGAGETIALVGENGAGKTTIVKLLCRLYDPTEGRILIDGVDIRDFRLSDLRSALGIIFQDYVRYSMSASDNVAIGDIGHRDDSDRILSAAKKSSAHSVISKLPEGYKQMLGRRFKGGVDLSGGEWQKLAIARVYMRDAQILVLDEPTASLDARSEFEVFQTFKELRAGKTAVIISHRFANVRLADTIFVLVHGSIEEQGTHERLVAKKGRYSELFRLQAAGYQ